MPKHVGGPTRVELAGRRPDEAGVHFVGGEGIGVRLFWYALVGDESLDIAIGGISLAVDSIPDFRFEIAPPGTDINVGDEVRIVTADFLEDDARKVLSQHRVLDGVVSNVDVAANRLTLSATIVGGNSGAAVLNSDMHLIGMVVGLYGSSRGSGKAVAVHVDAIRSKLCEWHQEIVADCD